LPSQHALAHAGNRTAKLTESEPIVVQPDDDVGLVPSANDSDEGFDRSADG
jgi:hypothetical protein